MVFWFFFIYFVFLFVSLSRCLFAAVDDEKKFKKEKMKKNSYGASLQGITPLLSALVSSSPGVTVCNIDNGFGAAMAAARILRTAAKLRRVQKAASAAASTTAGVTVSA